MRTDRHDKTPAAFQARRRHLTSVCLFGLLVGGISLLTQSSRADEGGVSFWIPGFFGSLAATPQQPGWSMANIFYNTNVKAGVDLPVPLNFSGTASASVKADVPLDIVIPQYVFATPVLGGQAAVALLGAYGRNDTNLTGTLNGIITPGHIPINLSIDHRHHVGIW